MSSPKSYPQALDPEDPFGPVIHSYSRAEALEDGALIDVTSMAREAGFRIPVALTRAVWESYVTVPPKVVAQDEPGRLWDILWMASLAGQASSPARPLSSGSVRTVKRRAEAACSSLDRRLETRRSKIWACLPAEVGLSPPSPRCAVGIPIRSLTPSAHAPGRPLGRPLTLHSHHAGLPAQPHSSHLPKAIRVGR
jgi:hypothetical protein